MRKAFIPVVLVLILVVVMSSGSMALYTQSEVLRGQLYTRVFVFKAPEKTTSYEFGLSGLALMPGDSEKELYRFALTNAEGVSNISDYDCTVTIASSGMAAATHAMDGLTFYLYNVTTESSTPVATVTAGELAYSGITFKAETQKSVEYKLTAKWTDTGNSEAQTALAAGGSTFPVRILISAQTDI